MFHSCSSRLGASWARSTFCPGRHGLRQRRGLYQPGSERQRRSMAALQYKCSVDAEPLHRYRAGGYHPVHLGDELEGRRYRILHKLGFGGYSTVWLARDERQQRYVAIKICVAEVGASPRELRVMNLLAQHSSSNNDSRHIVQLLDSFELSGPNGTHACLVLELLGPTVAAASDACGCRLSKSVTKQISRQVLRGLSFLHQRGVGHGDLHTGNIAFMVPNVSSFSEKDIMARLGSPHVGDVERLHGSLDDPKVPRYLVWPASFSVHASAMNAPVKIVDLGESFTFTDRPQTIHTPLILRPPEVIFGSSWDHRVDLWTLGCTLFELVTSQPPFDSLFITESRLVKQMCELIGDIPEDWQVAHVSGNLTRDGPLLQQWLEEVYFDEGKRADFSPEEILLLGRLIGRLMCYKPDDRISAPKALADEWVRD